MLQIFNVTNKVYAGILTDDFSGDSTYVLGRDLNSNHTGNAHGFSDSSYLSQSNLGYNSFDDRVLITNNTLSHHNGFSIQAGSNE